MLNSATFLSTPYPPNHSETFTLRPLGLFKRDEQVAHYFELIAYGIRRDNIFSLYSMIKFFGLDILLEARGKRSQTIELGISLKLNPSTFYRLTRPLV
jgi:hypothetical protein